MTRFGRRLARLLVAAVPLMLASAPPGEPPNEPPSEPSTGWELVFADEFDGDRLDTTRWSTRYDRLGELAASNWDNGEAQWYRPGNVTVGGGTLRLTARAEAVVGPQSGRTFPYTSGMVTSKPSFDLRYGRVEARMKLPAGRGFWPAFWLWPSNEQWPPEIDVMEFYGGDHARVHLTYHGDNGADKATAVAFDWTAGWHLFAVDWDAAGIVWTIDGIERYRVARSADIPMYLIVNLAVSNGKGAPAPDASTPFPATLQVDFIRVYRRAPSPEAG